MTFIINQNDVSNTPDKAFDRNINSQHVTYIGQKRPFLFIRLSQIHKIYGFGVLRRYNSECINRLNFSSFFKYFFYLNADYLYPLFVYVQMIPETRRNKGLCHPKIYGTDTSPFALRMFKCNQEKFGKYVIFQRKLDNEGITRIQIKEAFLFAKPIDLQKQHG